MVQPVLCLLTIHGIGFEQAPQNGEPGYADGLHQRLSHALGPDLLSDDPNRQRAQPGENGAIYVESLWAPQEDGGGSGSPTRPPTREEGLRRLGSWAADRPGIVNPDGAPLAAGGRPIAHVALVYSRLEPVGLYAGSAAVALEMAAVSAGHYATILGMARMAFEDMAALWQRPQSTGGAAPGLQARGDTPPGHHWFRLPFGQHPAPAAQPTGLLATIRNLEDDVAAYVSRNDLRERVRGFVREALLRLLSRPDVAGVVINAHSNGTVVAFDVLRDLPPLLAAKVRGIVTAGSPLRKYAQLFNWGTEAGLMGTMGEWTNYWDEHDPVADPLAPPANWRRGDALPAADAGQISLYHGIDPASGDESVVKVADRQVDNVAHGGSGGLPAHDYWDNAQEVIEPLAAALKRLL